MGSIDKALPHAGFYPDSQNRCSDGAKIRSIIESSKYFGTFFIARRFFLQSSRRFPSVNPAQAGVAEEGCRKH